MGRSEEDTSIIVLDKFIQATRDSGYKGTTSALAEIVDNSLQAGAKSVWITIEQSEDAEFPIEISVLDDGCGMNKATLRQALRFGGSSRFNDRQGMGRFGMGLPNSSLSQARRVEVYSWTTSSSPVMCYLDVDEIADGAMTEVPKPTSQTIPPVTKKMPKSGTLVVWSRCDRLSHSRISTLCRKLAKELGQVFRHYLWDKVSILINGVTVRPIDPLFLQDVDSKSAAALFGEPIPYEIAVANGSGSVPTAGKVTVTFTELPIHALHSLTNDEKRERGIANGAGVSVVRSNREVDFGWFFLNGKRRENYDDWWRCEVRFDPVLDEHFGITHTKQQIRPREDLLAVLTPDIESMAKALNNRVRHAHLKLKAGESTRPAEELAAAREKLLPPIAKRQIEEREVKAVKSLLKELPALAKDQPAGNGALDYRIVHAEMDEKCFFNYAIANGRFILILNPQHPFYRRIYQPLSDLESADAKQCRTNFDLLLLAAARAEASIAKTNDRKALVEHRARWSDVLATFLNK